MPETIKRFLFGFLPTFGIAFAYIPIVIIAAPSWDLAQSALLSNPTLIVYQPVVVPFIAGILAVAVRPTELLGNSLFARRALIVIAIFAVMAGAYFVVGDSSQALNDRIIEPVEWRDASVQKSFFELDSEIREALATKSQLCPKEKPGAQRPRECYQALLKEKFGDSRITLRKDMGLPSWWQRLMSMQGMLISAVMFVALIGYHLRSERNEELQNALLTALGLAALWIPIRVYSDWYINYGSFDGLSSNSILFIRATLIVVALFATYFRTLGGPWPKIFSMVTGGIGVIAGAIAAFQPLALARVAGFFSKVPFGFLVIAEVVLMGFIYVVVRPPIAKD